MRPGVYKIIFIAIGLFTMGYMVYALGWSEIKENIEATGSWFVPIVGSWLIIYIMNAFGFRAIIREPRKPATHLPFWRIFQLTVSGYAINYVTPFVALGGEPYRIMELQKHVGAAKASSSVLLYSLMHMFSHIVFWLLSTLLILLTIPLNGLLIGCCIVMIVLGGGLWLWFINVYQRGFTTSVLRFVSQIPFIGSRISDFSNQKRSILQEIDDHIIELYSQRRPAFYSSLLWEFGARVIGCAEIYFVAEAIGLGMSVSQAFIVSATSSLFANVLFFFPMQLGTREGGLVLSLQTIGLASGAGIFIGIVVRIREIIWIFIGLLLMGGSKWSKGKSMLTLAKE